MMEVRWWSVMTIVGRIVPPPLSLPQLGVQAVVIAGLVVTPRDHGVLFQKTRSLGLN
jgi:hypothetical protein